jgi:hypothetical protein
LSEKLNIEIQFDIISSLGDIFWVLDFIFDYSFKKQTVGVFLPNYYKINLELQKSEIKKYAVGQHKELFHIDKIDIRLLHAYLVFIFLLVKLKKKLYLTWVY